MYLTQLLTVAALAGGSAYAQLSNSTLLGILNTSQLSPATKFVELLTSNPEYQQILDLLEQPGNHTLFVPSDKVFAKHGVKINNTNTVIPSDEYEDNNSGKITLLGDTTKTIRILQQDVNTTNQDANLAKPFETGELQGYNVSDVLLYHIVQGYYTLDTLNQSTVLNTLVTNSTLDKNGIGLPVVVTNNGTYTNCDNDDDDNGHSNADVQNSGTLNVTNLDDIDDDDDDDDDDYVSHEVGNGVKFAKIEVYDILASNGVLHVIDDVLVPPGNLSDVLSKVSNAPSLNDIVSGNATLASTVSSATNVTIFVPTKDALDDFDDKNETESNSDLVLGHIVQNVYYADNLTELAVTNQSIPTLANTSVHFTEINGTVLRINNEAYIVKRNILTDSGVLHLLDKVIQPPAQ